MIPIRFGTDEQFAALRSMLRDAGYDETPICTRTGVNRIDEVISDPSRRQKAPPLNDTLDALIMVLLEGLPIAGGSWQSLVPIRLTESLEQCGLLAGRGGEYYCPIALYPVEGLYVVSDRDASTADTVYPALVGNTRRFLDVIPRTRCGSFLDVCAGTGIAALLAARDFADQSFAFDIAERSVQFAEFNRRLNGLNNLTNADGDLYAPAQGRTFDSIVSHPPYVPVLKPKFIFHDGGDDGEQIVKRVVEGLPTYLAPGGQFCMLSMASDRKDAAYEYRVRQWLGDAHGEFDVALVTRKLIEPADFVARSLLRGNSDSAEVAQWNTLFQSRGITTLVYGSLLIRRKTESRAPFTVRRQSSDFTHRPEMDWLLDWERDAADGSGATRALTSGLIATPGAELRVLNRLENGNWAAAEHLLQINYPFSMECQTQPWMAYLLSKCDGTKTGLDHLNDLVAEEVVYPGTDPQDFARALTTLISGGFLQFASGNSTISSS
jgi:SAM-dependent methyltransferase